MTQKLSLGPIEKALDAAASAHHDYEANALGGRRDEQWAGWYAGYVLGRLGDFTSPTSLTRWLEKAPGGDNWSASTAAQVMKILDSTG